MVIRVQAAALAALIVLGGCSSQKSSATAEQTASIPNQLMSENGLAPGVPGNQLADAPVEPAAPMPVRAAEYLKVAGADDLFERKAATLAVANSSDRAIRAFAQQMLVDHRKTSEALDAAAAQAGVSAPPPQLLPAQQQRLAELSRLRGTAFDRTYLAQQVAAHRAALALHRNYARQGDTAALKQAAAKAVLIIETHLARVQQLASG